MNGPWELIVYSLIAGAVWVLIISFLYERIARSPIFASGLPESLVEKTDISLFFLQYLIDLLFYVAIPTLGYGFFAIIFPLAGVRPALAAALALFAIGMLPMTISLTSRIKLQLPFLLLYLFANFLKMAGTLAIIGWLFSL
jgi:hypothetical protein